MYVCTYVRSSAQARTSRRSLRRRRRLDMYARARRQYRLGAYRTCETQFIAFESITQDVSQLPRPLFDSGRNVTRVCVHMHACVRGVPRVCVCMHACVDWYGLEMVRRRPARGKICACAFLVKKMFEASRSAVFLEGEKSVVFSLEQGVAQGCSFSLSI